MKRLLLGSLVLAIAGCSDSKSSNPAIAAFTAAPDTITAGQSAELVFGGTGSLGIDQGIGDVTGKSSVSVSPGVTTTYTLTASMGGKTTTAKTTVTVNAAPAAQTVTLVLVRTSVGNPVAGVPASFELRALNPAGNPNPGYKGTVSFTSDDPQAVLPAAVTFAPSDGGKKSVSATFKTAGTHSLTATDTTTSSLQATALVQVGPAAASACAISGLPATSTAGAQTGMRVSALDPFGNVATGYTGTITLSSSDAAALLEAPATFTASDAGSRAFSIQLRTAGAQTVTATDAASSITCQANVTVVAGTTILAVTFPGLGAGLDAWAGTAVTAHIRAQDALGNLVSSYAGTVHFTSSDAAATLPADATFTAGDAGEKDVSVTFATIGAQTFTATDTANPLIQGTGKTVTVHGLVYTDPAPGGKVRLVRNASSNARLVRLDLVSNTSLFISGAGATARNGAFGAGMNLPLDVTKVGPDATLLDVTAPAPSTAILALGTGPQAKAATLNAARGVLYSGISQKRTEAGSATVRGDVAVRPFPSTTSFYYSVRLVLTPGAAVGTVFDGAALPAGFRAAVRDRSGSDVFSGPDFAIGKLEVR
ncbi:MAG TPA: hypothetical protein VFN91_02540 [Myxococcaceae bacterium]|nr:hypothetical protein [Myxococcaceae bacterium]